MSKQNPATAVTGAPTQPTEKSAEDEKEPTPVRHFDILEAKSVLFRNPPQSMAQSSARIDQHLIVIDFVHQIVTVTDKRTKLQFSSPLSNVIEFRI